jgi:D-glycero-D-manno-heptose 1,7-bisphosphate phosphatase
MKRTIFFDIDGTLTTTISGETFKKHSEDVAVLPGIKEAIAWYKARGWQFIGISNQGGVGAGHKSIESATSEMKFTLQLIPELSAIYFCPDFEGLVCWKTNKIETHFCTGIEESPICQVSEYRSIKISDNTKDKDFFLKEEFRYRKPGAGMIYQATFDYAIDKSESWYVGDRSEDEACARNADINFMWADIFRGRFAPGMFEVRNVSTKQVEFLENIKL